MLALASLAVFLSGPAQTFGVSVFIDPIIAEFGWSRSLVSTMYSIATLAGAIPMILVGRQIDRVGNRVVMTLAAILFGLSLLWLSTINSVAGLLIGFAVLRACGSGILTLASRTLVPHWFVRRRGKAFSTLGLAGALSLALIPRTNEALIDLVGWRDAWRIVAVVILLGLAPILGLLVRNRPEDVGELPDGGREDVRSRRASLLVDAEHDWTLREAMGTRMFWAMLLAGAVPALVLTGVSFHQTSILNARGLPSSLAASVFAFESVVALPITLAAGWIVERFPIRYALAAAQAFLVAALLVLLSADTTALALAYAGLRGATTGLWAVSADVAWTAYFGKRHLGSIRGATFAVGTVGAAIGPVPLGLVFDATASYGGAVIAYTALPAVALLFIMTTAPPRRQQPGTSNQ
jgi:MFS family permease